MDTDLTSVSGVRVTLAKTPDFNLGQLHVCPARREIQVDGQVRKLEPRVMQVLVVLADARPAVVARDDLIAACWPGVAVSEDAINRCILALRNLAREFDPQPFTIETVARVGYALRETQSGEGPPRDDKNPRRFLRKGFALPLVALLFALVAGALAIWHQRESDVVSVAVLPATTSAEAKTLADDLTTKLGTMQTVGDGRTRLLDVGRAKKAQLRFTVSFSRQDGETQANVVLLNDREELLWSKDFRRPQITLSALEEQIAYTAAKVLDCATETRAGGRKLSTQIATLYLSACAGIADNNESSVRDLASALEQVTRSAPQFQPAWRKLLMQQAMILDWYDRTDADKLHTRAVIQAAASIHPSLPELDVARGWLLSTDAISARMKLVEGAFNRAPTNDAIAESYSIMLFRAGRLSAAVAAARRAVRTDPKSPFHRESLIVALATAGRTAEAEQELRQAETLWPDSVALREVHYLLSLRFTDPRAAIQLRDSGQLMPSSAPWQGSFLAARADRTPANVERALRDARAMYASDWRWISHIAQAFGEFGKDDELFAILLNWNRPDKVDFVTDVIFRPPLRNFRHDPRFMHVAKRLGLLEYWMSSGKWPDFCSEPDMPYDCRRRAAELAN